MERRIKKRLLTVALVVVLAACGVAGWAYYSLTHFSLQFTPAQMDDAQVALKGAFGEVLFGKIKPTGTPIEGGGLNAVLTPPAEPQGQGLIAAYQKDPEKFRRYSHLVDTAMTAQRIGELIQANRANYKFPLMSSELTIKPEERLDAWGHPYCITTVSRVVPALAVISGGPDAKSFACDQQQIRPKELQSANRPIFQTASGEVVVLVSGATVRGNSK